MKTLQVALPGSRGYPIHIGPGTLESHLPQVVREHARELVMVVTNETLAALYPGVPERPLAPLGLRVERCVLPDGERHKTLATLATIYDRLMACGAHRNTLLLAFGGGVVGDMAGFAAATFMRGVPCVQVPTTLLAQVDSSVGGKTAVNHPLGKNAIGAFSQPRAVVMDMNLLATLPPRELRAGLFELIKHGIIRDRELFAFLEERTTLFAGHDWAFWEEAVWRSCRVKAAVVAQDEREADLRAVLNFGHSLAHLIETHTGYASVLHGEAVGTGMLFAAFASRAWGSLPEGDYARIRAMLAPLLTPVRLPPLDEAAFTRLLMHDKKAEAETLRFVVLHGLGEVGVREGTRPAELWPLFGDFLRAEPDALHLTPE